MSKKDDSQINIGGIAVAAVIALLVAIIIILSASLFYFEFSQYNTSGSGGGYLGTLGDFIGGLLNPIAAILSVGLLAYTLFQNNQALELTRREMKKQADAADELARNSVDQANLLLEQFKEEQRKSRDWQFVQRYTTLSDAYQQLLSKKLPDHYSDHKGMISVSEAIDNSQYRHIPYRVFGSGNDNEELRSFLRMIIPVVMNLRFQVDNITSFVVSEYEGRAAQFHMDYSHVIADIPVRVGQLMGLLRNIDYVNREIKLYDSGFEFKDFEEMGSSINSLLQSLNDLFDDIEERAYAGMDV